MALFPAVDCPPASKPSDTKGCLVLDNSPGPSAAPVVFPESGDVADSDLAGAGFGVVVRPTVGWAAPSSALSALLKPKPSDTIIRPALDNSTAPGVRSAALSGNGGVAEVKYDVGVRVNSKVGTLGSAGAGAGGLPIDRTESAIEWLNTAGVASPKGATSDDAPPAGWEDSPTPDP